MTPLRLGNIRVSPLADWSAYAEAYDLLSEYNPAYQSLLHDFEMFLTSIEPPTVIYDIGGGTGNYTAIAAATCPDSIIHFVEPDSGMLRIARKKLSNYSNIIYNVVTLESVNAANTADLLISVHSLYAMADPRRRIAEMRKLLRPGGLIYLIDLGRLMNVGDWRYYLFSHLKRKHGIADALSILWQGREIAKQNTAIRNAQKSGAYWLHDHDDFAAMVAAEGFEILRQETVYRGYSDLLVCRATT